MSVPKKAKEKMHCMVQIRSPDGQKVEQMLTDALEKRLNCVEQMAETCLLMMHLELRVHCFYHLLPLARNGGAANTDDNEREIAEFERELISFKALLANHIAETKLKYLFDGLGHLCASIFINSR